MSPVFKSLCATSLILLLSACGATTQTATVEKKPEPITVVTHLSAAEVASLPEKSAPEETVLPPLPKIRVLMGKTRQEIEAVFGTPVLLRKDKPAEVWQYLTKDCALHLVFYPTTKAKTDDLTVQHISTNDRNKVVVVDSEACFGSQLRRVGEDRAQALS